MALLHAHGTAGRAPAAALCAPAEPGLLELLAPSGLLRTSATLALFHLAFNHAANQLAIAKAGA